MRCNKQELITLASQTSNNFDREGVLVLKEKQDGFFRRSEDCAARWFRLRGNLLFYLKGPEPWYEPMGVIVLGLHQVTIQSQDENGQWPFQIVWENGVQYRMTTFHESERTLWLKAMQMASYDNLKSQIIVLNERLNKIRPVVDIATYRSQKGITVDINEVPVCELALSCDNLLCDAHGRPPSPLIIVYVKFSKGLNVRYGATEIFETCSNPCFSKTILFRASDGLTGDAVVRLVVYNVKEKFSETYVPMGSTSFKLSTIQEAQRLRVALLTKESKTVGFVTINGWSLEPSYIGASPIHTNDKNCIEITQKILSHRRSQSLPPRLGLKLKFPAYGSLLKQNFVNVHQVTYRFHSGLGGDVTVHEIMAEPKFCYHLPIQLLDIYIEREKQLLEELLSVGKMQGQWENKQLELVNNHISLLKFYYHSKRAMQHVDNVYFKPSSRKEESSLEFVPVNLHLQRMWVHNDTLNKTGFHDIVTVGAFTSHTNKSEKNGGLIWLVQHVKDINSTKAAFNSATANKIQSEYENLMTVRRLRDIVSEEMEKAIVSLQAKQVADVATFVEDIKSKVKRMLVLWDPSFIEESLSFIGWAKQNNNNDDQSLQLLTRQMSAFESTNSNYETFTASSSSSSKDTSPTFESPSLYSSVPNIWSNNHDTHKNCDDIVESSTELQFHNDYFKSDRQERKSFNHSFRSVCLPLSKPSELDRFTYNAKSNSLRYDYKTNSEQVSYRSLIGSLTGSDRRKKSELRSVAVTEECVTQLDPITREKNLMYLKGLVSSVDRTLKTFTDSVTEMARCQNDPENIERLHTLKSLMDAVKNSIGELVRWQRISHVALRLRCEAPTWSREHAALQKRRDICFSQALTAVTSGLLCWLSSAPVEVVVKLLTSGLGPICGFEGLLSLYATELGMWEDMVVAVEDLQTVSFILIKVGHSNSALPQITGTRGALTMHIPVSESVYSKFTNKEQLTFTITAVFFNIGINGKATLAEQLGDTIQQYYSNNDNLDRLNKYYYRYSKTFPADLMAATRASSRAKPLEEVMENLRIAVQKKLPKNVEVLQLAASAIRLMNGIRLTSCKSAKDRTGMSVTREQAAILASEYHLADHELKKALYVLRSEGCRRENAYKNIGVKKYAFTKKQVLALPAEYRPPDGTYGTVQT